MNKEATYLKIKNLNKSFGQFTALEAVSIDIQQGDFVCFLGPSGCGKTTLLRCIAGLEIQTNGHIYQNERLISDLPTSQRDFGIVFQSYALFPNLSCFENIAYGLKNLRWNKNILFSQSCRCVAMNSGPLSERINSGLPCLISSGCSVSETSFAFILGRTATQSASRVYSSRTVNIL